MAPGRVALTAAVILLLWALSDVVLLLLFAVLVAVVLRGAAEAIAERTKLSPQVTLAVLAIVALVGFGALCYWIGPRLLQQMQDLVSRLTQQIEALREHIASTSWGHTLSQELSPSALSGGGLLGTAGTAVTLTFRSLADMVLLVVTALYLAAAPGLYLEGALRLLPRPSRGRMREVAHEVAHTWQLWVLGQSIDMLTVGVMAAGGLWAAGVPAPFALAVVAALFTFILYFGAIVAAIPAVLVALTVRWSTALVALGVYVACHLVEGYAVAPLVQARLVELPPALSIVAMAVLGTLFGPLGIILATPIAAAGLVVVRELYVVDVLDDPAGGMHPCERGEAAEHGC